MRYLFKYYRIYTIKYKYIYSRIFTKLLKEMTIYIIKVIN